MSDKIANELQEYWTWIHELSEGVKQVVLHCWDQTGRPTTEPFTPVIMLLDTSDTEKEFTEKCIEMMSMFDLPEYKIQDDINMYWSVYSAGLLRMEKGIRSYTDRPKERIVK